MHLSDQQPEYPATDVLPDADTENKYIDLCFKYRIYWKPVRQFFQGLSISYAWGTELAGILPVGLFNFLQNKTSAT